MHTSSENSFCTKPFHSKISKKELLRMRQFFKTFLFFLLMFAANEGFSSSISIEKLYQDTLSREYSKLSELKHSAEKRKTAYIVSGVLALILLGVFAYFFKLAGVLVALIMIAAGYFTLKDSEPVVGAYEEAFKQNIISSITELSGGYEYVDSKLGEEELASSQLFAPRVKLFSSWDLYKKEDVQFSYIHVVFDTKENASVERIAENIFDGYLIMIDSKNNQEGVLVSESLRDKVAHMDMTMSSFFSQGKRAGKQNGFDIYGEVSVEDIDKVSQLKDKKIAVSFRKDKTYIAFYKQDNPFSVDVFKTFDLLKAKHYASSIEEIESLLEVIR